MCSKFVLYMVYIESFSCYKLHVLDIILAAYPCVASPVAQPDQGLPGAGPAGGGSPHQPQEERDAPQQAI